MYRCNEGKKQLMSRAMIDFVRMFDLTIRMFTSYLWTVETQRGLTIMLPCWI